MRKVLIAIMVIIAMLFADAPRGVSHVKPLFAQGKIKIQLTETAQNSGLLKIDNSAKSFSLSGFKTLDDLNAKHSVTKMKNAHMGAKNKEMEKKLGLDRWYLLEIPKDKDVLKVIEDYKKDPNVEFANPEYYIYRQATPTDPLYTSQWGHNNTAQMLAWKTGDTYNHTGTAIGTAGFDTNAQVGWSGTQGYGSTTVIIGIIDSGVDTAHEDINDVTGYDFGDGDTNPMDNSAEPGHGTCCAGCAAGIVGNGKGVAGTAGNCKIMPLKVADSAGSMTFTSIEDALTYGADNGAAVLSMSLGAIGVTPGQSPSTDAALVYAYNAGCTLLAATGNENSTSLSYPANHINVLGVGGASPGDGRKRSSSRTTEVNPGVSTDKNGVTVDNEIWWGSNYGTTTADGAGAVDFIAPCIIPSTDITGSGGYQSGNYYTYFNGTSSATPYAAGFAALIKSKYPTYTPAQVAALMKSTCIDIVNVESGAGWDKYSGYGMIDIGAALGTATPPAVPTLLLPANASSTSDLTPTFDWNDVSGATSYTIQIDNTSSFASPEYTNSPTVSTYTPGANLATGTWYWRVLATNASGSSAYTSGWSVILGTVPAVPVLSAPANGSSTTDLTPTFTWGTVSGATSYTIQIDNDIAFGSPDYTNSPTTATYTPGANLAAGTWYWRVLATNAFGSSLYSSGWSVILGSIPVVPTLLLPANASSTSDLTPTFDWSDVSGATSYTIQIDNNSNFGSPEYINSPTVSTYTPGANLALGTWYWRVLTTNTFGSSAYTTGWSIVLGNAPAVPTLLLPSDAGLTTDQTPAFDWSDVSGATSYTILADNNIDFGSPEVNQSPSVSTYTPGANLAYGTYYWKVSATNTFGSSVYTTAWSVEIGTIPAAPTLLTPADLSSTMDQTPAFDWSDVSLATSYTILVDNNSNFSSPEITQSPAVSTYTPIANLANGTYYWKVLSTNAFGSSSYSAACSFTIAIPNITLSSVQINATAAPEGTDTDSFNINNTGDTNLDYTITKEYAAKGVKADITVHSNNFASFPGIGYTNSNWTAGTGTAVIAATSSVNPITGILTSGTFDGTVCSSLYLDFTQNFAYKNSSYAKVEYYNGTSWTEIYNATASTTTPQHIALPVLASNMQIRFTGYMTKQGTYASWEIDNIVVSGPEYVPAYTWLTINSSLTGSVIAAGSNAINLTCSAAGLAEGTYNANITVATNDPDEPSKVLPVQFVVTAPPILPGSVTLVSPTDTANLYILNPALDWGDAADATGYEVLGDNNSDFSSPEINTSTVSSAYNSSLSVGTYYWKVRGTNSAGNGAYSAAWSFSILPLSIPVNVISSFTDPNLTVSWDVVAGATSYDVYSSTDPYGTFTFVTNVATNSYATTATDAKLFWYIKAKN